MGTMDVTDKIIYHDSWCILSPSDKVFEMLCVLDYVYSMRKYTFLKG